MNDLLVCKKEAERAFKVLGGYSKKPLYASNRMAKESSCTADPFSFTNNMKLREDSVVWASLPLTLVKLGKVLDNCRSAYCRTCYTRFTFFFFPRQFAL